MDFLVNYPAQIVMIGIMVWTWTIHHKAKLNIFKKVTFFSSYKNMSLSFVNHHQRWMCYKLAAGELLHAHLEFGSTRSGNGLNLVRDD